MWKKLFAGIRRQEGQKILRSVGRGADDVPGILTVRDDGFELSVGSAGDSG
jgi:hypothetical protein